MVMRNGCLTRLARLAENKHVATHTRALSLRDNQQPMPLIYPPEPSARSPTRAH